MVMLPDVDPTPRLPPAVMVDRRLVDAVSDVVADLRFDVNALSALLFSSAEVIETQKRRKAQEVEAESLLVRYELARSFMNICSESLTKVSPKSLRHISGEGWKFTLSERLLQPALRDGGLR